jgi:hypothetical protein
VKEDLLVQKRNRLFVVLSGIFITNALLAELIGTKIFSAETVAGLTPGSLSFLGLEMEFNLTAGAVIWPIVFITTDIINEYFGKPGVRRISFFTAGLIAYSFLVLAVAMALPPARFWLEVNSSTPDGSLFNIDYAFSKVFGQGLRIIVGSLTAFLLGQLIDVFVFQRLRRVTGQRLLWLRATGSTLVSQLIDSFVVLIIAFYGMWSWSQLFSVSMTNYVYKFAAAIVLTPLVYLGHYMIDRYLGRENAARLSDEAAAQSRSLI